MAFASSGVDFNNVGSIAAAGELAAELSLPDVGAGVLDLLTPIVERGVSFSISPPILLPRAAAAAARACNRLSEARELLSVAERVAATSGAAAEVGLCALEAARLAAASGGRTSEVNDAAQKAAEVFTRLDMLGALGWLRGFVDASGAKVRALQVQAVELELSNSEAAVLRAYSEGRAPQVIGDDLLLSERTVEACLDRLRRRLGITSPEAARTALRGAPGDASSPARRPELAELTTRELEVLGLIARGLTNQQIADELVISPHTAIRHVANILAKTGAANRTEAARLAG